VTEPLLDPDRILALSYVPTAARPAIEALWRLDVTMGAVLASSQPMIGRIKLAWWREALEALDRGPPTPEPMLQSVAAKLLPHGFRGAELAALEEGWAILATDAPLHAADIDDYAVARGRALFRLSARLLDRDAGDEVGQGGEAWALVDLARHSRNVSEAAAALAAARIRLDRPVQRWPSRLRPLGMLVMLARRDAAHEGAFEPQGSPARMVRMLRHRLTGR
jgi:phytoene synthase